ncbi:MAG TPA: tetratricopeptide repeat protein [Burkholderiaceae bacterium]|nr:tetratricopeptide repeat protein [Burkholderiaceae bacterium]
MQTYNLRAIQSMLGLSRTVVSRLIAAGFVTPARGKRREYLFGFRDIVLLRTANELQQAKIPTRKILRSLQRLRSALPEELPLSGLRISAIGSEIVVSEGDHQWHADTGQLLLDFELRPTRGTISVLGRATGANNGSEAAADHSASSRRTRPGATPRDWFERGIELEADDPAGAESAYRAAIAAAPDCADPYLNLGVLLTESGRHAEAERLYRDGLRICSDEPVLHFNLAVTLEDLGRSDEALRAYEDCLRLAPGFADAHFNAARLYESAGHARKAIRHYSEYRRLQRH